MSLENDDFSISEISVYLNQKSKSGILKNPLRYY